MKQWKKIFNTRRITKYYRKRRRGKETKENAGIERNARTDERRI